MSKKNMKISDINQKDTLNKELILQKNDLVFSHYLIFTVR